MRALDGRIELNILAKVELVGDVIQPTLDFGLTREFLAPAPSFVELFGKEVLINIGFGIETRARVSIPIPRAADAGGGVDHSHVHSLLAQTIQLIKPGDTGSDDHGIEARRLLRPVTSL